MASYEFYSKLRNEKGLNDSQVSKITGIGRSTFTDWKNGRSTPKRPKIVKIAEALGVSPDVLDPSAQSGGFSTFYRDTVDLISEHVRTKSPNISFNFDDLKLLANIKADPNRASLFAWLAAAPEGDVALVLNIVKRLKEGGDVNNED